MLGHRELTIDDYMEILRRRYWILLLTAILGSAGAYAFSRALPNEYQSRTLVLVQQPKVAQKFVTPVVNEQINQRLANMTEQILSATQLQPIVEQYHLYEKELSGSPVAIRVARLRKAITVTPIQPIVESQWAGIPGFTVKVTLNDPRVAQQVCAEITSMFLEQNARWRAQAAQDTTDFLSKQIDDAKHALDEKDAKLTAFKMRYLGKLPDEAQTNINILTSYNSQLEAATEALNRTQQDKVYLESQLAQQLAAWKATRSGSNPLTLEEQLADLQNKLVMLRARYTDDYPDVIKLKSDIAHLQQKINAAKAESAGTASTQANSDTPAYAEPAQIQQLRRQIHQYDEIIAERTKQQASLQKKIDEYQARVQLSPLVDQQFTEMTRDYQTALEFYRGLLTKKAQADMGADLERRQQAEEFRVIDPASFSAIPSSPNRLLFAGGGVGGGLCLGIAIALWLEMRDKLIRTERDVEFYLQIPTLALVPMVDKRSGPRNKYLPSGLTGGGDSTVKEISGG
jgi:polysaccharide chain length determinant protein (PEP-CTERM system associated)